ncbi:MAG: 50S ribosomal protein L25/general stress protein Ctc [Parabacteroides sp.]|jgi:large subunit ribosomal protein L25|nr:50S ribosomal protein L25/general stress protein Ctc [Parabacteroides sp.]MDD3357942.1 50S ribosomal protein L25/general stress protein Ctc [Parabacteroides sp.]MDD4404078.1 50S ribosomal protein L25/general stress protein Ctc [Parabacteroides sp.]
MKTFQLEGTPRTEIGKKAAKAIRKEDMIPAVIYGGESTIHFNVTKDAVRKLIYTPEIFVIDLTIGDKKTKAVIKDMQFHPVTDAVLHIDFLEVFDNKPIVMEVPVALEGFAEGVKAGGKLSLEMRKLKVKALYNLIPEKLTINIDSLGLGKTLQVAALSFEGLEIMNAKNAVVCAVKLTRAARGAAAKGN